MPHDAEQRERGRVVRHPQRRLVLGRRRRPPPAPPAPTHAEPPGPSRPSAVSTRADARLLEEGDKRGALDHWAAGVAVGDADLVVWRAPRDQRQPALYSAAVEDVFLAEGEHQRAATGGDGLESATDSR